MRDYSDIIDLGRPLSSRPPMPIRDRAAQFAPFAALAGHAAAIVEAARVTGVRRGLSDIQIEQINCTLAVMEEQLRAQSRADKEVVGALRQKDVCAQLPHVSVVYFEEDAQKDGGRYHSIEGEVRLVDSVNSCLVFTDGSKIRIPDIFSLEII